MFSSLCLSPSSNIGKITSGVGLDSDLINSDWIALCDLLLETDWFSGTNTVEANDSALELEADCGLDWFGGTKIVEATDGALEATGDGDGDDYHTREAIELVDYFDRTDNM